MERVPFSLALYNAMARHGLSTLELSRQSGVSTSSINFYLTGKHLPTEENLAKMARVVKINYDNDRLKEAKSMNTKRRTANAKDRIEEMRSLRAQGMTNKQIAERLGIGVSTVYENIGKMSMDVRKHEEQNKPCPIPDIPKVDPLSMVHPEEPEHDVVEAKPAVEIHRDPPTAAVVTPMPVRVPEQKVSFAVLSRHEVVELQGSVCVFKTDTDSSVIELSDKNGGQLTGLLEYTDIPRFIRELNNLYERRVYRDEKQHAVPAL